MTGLGEIRDFILSVVAYKVKFDWVVQELWGTIVEKEIGHQEKDWKIQRGAMNKLKNEITPKIREIETDIHSRLRSHGNWKD